MASRRFSVFAGGATCAVALAGLVVASSPSASAHQASVTRTGQVSTRPTEVGPRPPIGRAKASGLSPFTGPADTASPWTPLVNPPPFGTPGTMLLESDGTVLVHNEPDNNTTGGTNAWWKLTPDSHGSYTDGAWSQIASMPAAYTPLYFASAILPDGRMLVEGGEYIGENAVWSNAGAIYNPVTSTWTSVAPPPGWTSIGDAASEVLPDGTFMLQQPCNNCATDPDLTVDAALFNAKTMKWKVIPGTGKNDPNDEEGWNLEPNGQVLAWTPGYSAATQLFNPRTDVWSFAGNTAANGILSIRSRLSRSGRRSGHLPERRSWSGREAPRKRPRPAPRTLTRRPRSINPRRERGPQGP